MSGGGEAADLHEHNASVRVLLLPRKPHGERGGNYRPLRQQCGTKHGRHGSPDSWYFTCVSTSNRIRLTVECPSSHGSGWVTMRCELLILERIVEKARQDGILLCEMSTTHCINTTVTPQSISNRLSSNLLRYAANSIVTQKAFQLERISDVVLPTIRINDSQTLISRPIIYITVQYIGDCKMESKSENQDSNADTESVPFSAALSAITRYILPVVLLLLSLNYVRLTYGNLSWQNLRYPYLIIGLMIALLVLIMIEEAIDLKNTEFSVNTRTAVENYVERWNIPIKFAILLVVYVVLIPTLGFFTGSAVFMMSSMYVTSVGSRAVAAGVITGTLGLIWILFVEFINIRPPQGVVDELIMGLIL